MARTRFVPWLVADHHNRATNCMPSPTTDTTCPVHRSRKFRERWRIMTSSSAISHSKTRYSFECERLARTLRRLNTRGADSAQQFEGDSFAPPVSAWRANAHLGSGFDPVSGEFAGVLDTQISTSRLDRGTATGAAPWRVNAGVPGSGSIVSGAVSPDAGGRSNKAVGQRSRPQHAAVRRRLR